MSFENVEDVYALTPMQEGLLFHSLSEPGSGVFIDQVLIDLETDDGQEPFQPETLQAAWQELLRRHTVLRSIFLWDGLDEPLQVVRQEVDLPWQVHDLRNVGTTRQQADIDAFLVEDRRRGFELAEAPLLRMTLWRVGERKWTWLWTFHHILLDGWSVRLLLHELRSIYQAKAAQRPAGLPDPWPFTQYLGWHGRQDRDRDLAFWRGQLEGFGAQNRLDAFVSASKGSSRASSSLVSSREIGSTHRQTELRLPSETSQRLSAFAREHRLTLGTVLMGVWAQVLSLYSRDRDVIFGLSSSGRRPELDGIEQGVGLFIETLPLRITLPTKKPLVDWLRDVQRRQLAIHQAGPCPLAQLQREQQDEGLFETLLVIENHPPSLDPEAAGESDPDGADLPISRFEILERSNYPFALLVLPGKSLDLLAVHDHSRFPSAFVDRLLGRVAVLLDRWIDHAQTPVDEIPLLSESEQSQLEKQIEAHQPAETPKLAEPPESTMHGWIARVARERADASAVICGDRQLTYAQLESQSDRLARAIRRLKSEIGEATDDTTGTAVIGLYVHRSVEAVVGMLGILKAGAAYLPLDPTYPESHVRKVLKDARVGLVLTQEGLSLPSPDLIRIDLDRPDLWPAAKEDLAADDPDALAYVIYTSGSTGIPKGVEVTHRNLLYSTAARLAVYSQPVGRYLLLSSMAFDSSVAGLFWTLVTGGTLVLPEPDQERDIHVLRRLIREHGVTHSLCLPALYEILLEESDPSELESLEVMIVAGEACAPDLGPLHRKILPNTRLFNEYGPTEGTVWCTVHELGAESSDPVPIGRPIPGTTALLLDPEQQPVPQGLAGELWISGPGVARGYLHRAHATQEVFRVLPAIADGTARFYRTGDLAVKDENDRLVFLGRADSQIKIRGHRIELGGVEAQLRQDLRVADTKVRVIEAGGRRRLTAFVVLQEKTPNTEPVLPEQILRDLKARVPEPMVPDRCLILDQLPRLPNGKLDEPALVRIALQPASEPASSDPNDLPVDPIERTVAEVWQQVLGIERVGRLDHFFELGGDSILGIRVVSRLRQEGLAVEPRELASHPTVEALAAVARDREAAEPAGEGGGQDSPWVGDLPLLPIQKWFLDRGLPEAHHWNMTRGFEVDPDFEPELFRRALTAVVRHHDALRARFWTSETSKTSWRQELVDPEQAEVSLEIVDLAPEQAWSSHLDRAQGSLRLDQAPLLKALLCRPADGNHRLFLIVHHLIIDAVSWSVVLEDLETAYDQLRNGRSVDLPPVSTPIKTFADALHRRFGTPDLQDQLPFWTQAVDPRALELPGSSDNRAAGSTEAEARNATVSVMLSDPTVQRPEELMLTAMVVAMTRLRGHGGLWVELEKHGRLPEHLPGEQALDLSRTVGWLTTSHPILLRAEEGDPEGLKSALDAIRARLDQIPGDGSGFRLLRDLHDPGPLKDQPEPRILFNYLGRVTQRHGLLRDLTPEENQEVLASSRHGTNLRSHDQEINAWLRTEPADQSFLEIRWTYLPSAITELQIERLLGEFEDVLNALLGTAAVAEDVPRADNFPDAGLDADEFARLDVENIEDVFRLTEVQETLLAHRASAVAGSGAGGDRGTLVQHVELLGALRPEALEAAWRQTVDRHAVLRASVHWQKLKHPVQVVAEQVATEIEWVDRRSEAVDGKLPNLDELIRDFRAEGIDPSRAPAWRLDIWRVAERNHLMVWACHHLLLDGWSCLTVLQEVVDRYNAGIHGETFSANPAPAFRDIVTWARGPKPSKAAAFWARQGIAARDFLTHPGLGLGSMPPKTHHGDGPSQPISIERTLDHGSGPLTMERLGARARNLGVSTGSLLVGCWALMLAEVTRSPMATLGFVASGRSAPAWAFPAIGDAVGMLSNVLPLGIPVHKDDSLKTFFSSVLRRLQDAQSFEHVPLTRLFEAGGVTLKRAPFDTLLAFANFPSGAQEEDSATAHATGISLGRFSGDLTSGFPITLAFQPGSELRLRLEIEPGVLSTSTAEALLERFEALLKACVRPEELEDVTETVATLLDRALGDLGNPGDPRLIELQADPAGAGEVATDGTARRPRGGTDAESPRTATEAQVMRIWNDLIAIQEFSPDDNFFELGGHSLLVPALVQRIKSQFGVELALGLIYQNATVRALADAIDDQLEGHGKGHSAGWSSLVPIRPQGSRRPLFLIHGLGGEVGWFYDLASYLDPEMPLYGLQAPPEPHSRLEAMADHYVAEVQRLDPTGPYRLGGYCVGGGIAFEMARRLSSQGRSVEWVVLIDSVPQAHAQQQGGAKVLARRMRRLFSKPPSEMVASVSDAARRATQRAAQRVSRSLVSQADASQDSLAAASSPEGEGQQGKLLELDDVLDMRTLPKVYHQAARRHFAAMRDYAPGTYPGDVQLLRTDDPRFDEDFGWGEWVQGRLAVDRIPGRHADVLKEPHVAVVGAKIDAVLARLDDRDSDDPGADGGDPVSP